MKTNYQVRYAAHPRDAKGYDTARLREDFLIEKVFAADEVNMVYSMYDRMVVGGAMPVDEGLKLEAIDPLKAEYFLSRRELGIFNVGSEADVKTFLEHIEEDIASLGSLALLRSSSITENKSELLHHFALFELVILSDIADIELPEIGADILELILSRIVLPIRSMLPVAAGSTLVCNHPCVSIDRRARRLVDQLLVALVSVVIDDHIFAVLLER